MIYWSIKTCFYVVFLISKYTFYNYDLSVCVSVVLVSPAERLNRSRWWTMHWLDAHKGATWRIQLSDKKTVTVATCLSLVRPWEWCKVLWWAYLFACPPAYLKYHTADPHQSFCACWLWSWLGYFLLAFHYIMYCTSGFVYCYWQWIVTLITKRCRVHYRVTHTPVYYL